MISRGCPEYIRSDNGAEFTSNKLREWLREIGVITAYIEPGSPWEIRNLFQNSRQLCLKRVLCVSFGIEVSRFFKAHGWSQRLLESATIKDKLYFATGDISVNTLYMMDVVFFIRASYKIPTEDPYQLVKGRQMTFDKMIEMAQGLYQDLNNNSAKVKKICLAL